MNEGIAPADDQSTTAEEEVAATEYQQLISKKMAAFAGEIKRREGGIFAKRLSAEELLALQEIGDRYGISHERVRQLECRLKAKLKAYWLEEFTDVQTLHPEGRHARITYGQRKHPSVRPPPSGFGHP